MTERSTADTYDAEFVAMIGTAMRRLAAEDVAALAPWLAPTRRNAASLTMSPPPKRVPTAIGCAGAGEGSRAPENAIMGVGGLTPGLFDDVAEALLSTIAEHASFGCQPALCAAAALRLVNKQAHAAVTQALVPRIATLDHRVPLCSSLLQSLSAQLRMELPGPPPVAARDPVELFVVKLNRWRAYERCHRATLKPPLRRRIDEARAIEWMQQIQRRVRLPACDWFPEYRTSKHPGHRLFDDIDLEGDLPILPHPLVPTPFLPTRAPTGSPSHVLPRAHVFPRAHASSADASAPSPRRRALAMKLHALCAPMGCPSPWALHWYRLRPQLNISECTVLLLDRLPIERGDRKVRRARHAHPIDTRAVVGVRCM